MNYATLLTPRHDQLDSYGQVRRDTLNFESCGGERHSPLDLTLAPMGQLIRMPVRIARRVIVSFHRKERDMVNEHGAGSMNGPDHTVGKERSDYQRTERFVASGTVRAKIFTRSGDVVVHAEPGDRLEVTLSCSSSKFAYLLDDAIITFDAKRNELEVRTQSGDRGARPQGPAIRMKRSWFDFGGTDLDVHVVVPTESALEVATVSGDTVLHGALGEVRVSGVSGDVVATDPCHSMEVRTASGDVRTGRVRDSLSCRSASGDVDCLGSAMKTEITSASGDVIVTAEQPGRLVVRAVSGDVHVRVARGLAVDVNGNTVSGDMGTNIDLDATGDAGDGEELVSIKISTVSGDIRIDKAS